MKRQIAVLSAAVMCCVALALTSRAVNEPERGRLPNFDKRETPAEPQPDQVAAVARLRARVPGAKVERDVIGAPKFIASTEGFLTGPNGEGKGVSAEAARAVPAQDAHRAVKVFLNDHAPLVGHGAEVLKTARTKRDFATPHSGLRTTVWEQELDGITVFEAVLIAHVTKRGELVSIGSQFVPEPARAADKGHPNRAAFQANPAISAARALALAAKNVGEEQDAAEVTTVEAREDARLPEDARPPEEKRQRLRARSVKQDAEARLVWLPLDRATLRLCWELIFTSQSLGEMFRVLIDAQTGEALVRQGLTEYISNASYRVYTSDSPTPFSPGHATRLTNQPPLVPRTLVVTRAYNTNASPNGWIDDGVNEPRGNNVDAHLDRDDNNTADTPRTQGSPARVFDFPINFSASPTTYGDAAVVQLFYYCNWMHDRLYELGFTEAAGNFQINNFGRGGAGNDPVQADAQDGGGFNNANFATPPDGSSGRMQMYLWDGPNPDRDGDFDGEVVLHEYAHGLSNRRVGGGVGISALQSRGMGEGWSDFYGIALLAESSDDIHGNWARGGYSRFLAGGTFLENYYFGGRRYPYSTDMTKNPLTLKDIDPTQADPHLNVPRSPIVGNQADQVHNQGNVWCVTLWDVRANLITKHGFAVGNELTLKLVTDGLNLSPPNPTFLQARDGIIQADLVLTEGANQIELWRAFAKRGMGFSATSPASTTTVGVRESYDLPDDLRITPVTDISGAGPAGGPFAPSSWVFTLTNVGTNTITWTVQSHGLLEVSPSTGTLPPAGLSVTVTSRLSVVANDLPAGNYTDTLMFSNTLSGVGLPRRLALTIGGTDYFTELFDSTGPIDLAFRMITFTPDGSTSFYNACRVNASVFPTDPAGGTVLTLTDDSFSQVTLTSGAQVSIYGVRTNVLYVGSNGYLTLRQGDSGLSPSFANHFRLPRMAALFTDLNPGGAGTVSWRQLPDRVAVTFQNVPRFGATDTNSFQMELFFDGRLRMTWLRLDATAGLAGLSAGNGTPPDFTESDLTSYGPCLPVLTVNVPTRANENAGVLPNAGEVRIPLALANDFTIALSSTDPAMVAAPASVVILAGQFSARFNLTVGNDGLLNGSRQVRITASAGGYRSGSDLFIVDDDETAALSVSLPANAREGDGVLPGAGRVSVSAPPDRSVVVRLSALVTNELIVPAPAVAIIPAGQTEGIFNLQVIEDNRYDGTRSASITASVQNWASGTASMSILDNEVPVLTMTTPAELGENSGTVTNGGRILLGGIILSNLVVTLGSLAPSELTVPASVVILSNGSSAFFNLRVINDTAPDGPQVVPVFASAPGFGSVTNFITVADDEAPNEPFRPHPEHLSNDVPLNIVLSWNAGEGEQIINGNFETGGLAGWGRENRGNGDFIVNSGAFDPESPDGPLPPYAGNFSALSRQQWAGTHALYQDVSIPSGAAAAHFSWAHRVRNFAAGFGPAQGFRVELRQLNDQVLATPFVSGPSDALLGDWAEFSADLGGYRGQTLRVAFVAEDTQDFLNAHLDNVSVQLTSVLPSTYDVYFGTNAAPGPAELLGNTTNTFWTLPPLESLTDYYWQVVARRATLMATGPVWQFRTLALSGSNQPPTVTITNPPANYLLIYTPTNYLIGATASDPGGAVSKVEFFINDVKLGEDASAPYSVNWANPLAGTYALKAIATDNNGASNVAPIVQVVVNRRGGAPITIVPADALWKYLDNGSDQGTAWRGTNFNDTLWAEGPAELGYGDGDEATVVDYGPDINNKYITTYFRHTFTNDAVLAAFTLNLVRDDGAVVYLNGTEVFRSNMPGGTVTNRMLAAAVVDGLQESQYFTVNVNPILVRRGKNVVAVEVHQRTVTSSDVSFKLAVTGVANSLPLVTLTAPAPNTVLTAPPTVPVAAAASDQYGSIARVEFFAGATSLGSDFTAPYGLAWQPVAGTYALKAVATDNTGGTNRSEIVTVTILPPPSMLPTRTGNTLSLAWPATAHEFALESTASLSPPIQWTPATNEVMSVDGQFVVTVDTGASSQFFRLARP